MEDNYREVKKAEPCLKLIHMDQVEVEEIEWLFYPFIPYGKVTIIQGDPGEGKTTVVLQIIAKLTKGEELDTEVSVGEWIETVEYDYPGFHLSMDCFWCEIVKGDLVLKEHEAARWLTREELTDVEWLPADVAVAEKIEEEMD